MGRQSPLPVFPALRIDEGGRDPPSRQLPLQKRPGRPVEMPGSDDVPPLGKGSENRHRDCRHTTRKEEGCLGALESSHLLAYERLIRIVAIPGIEQLRSRLTGPSEKRSALYDRQNNRCSKHGFGQTGMNSDRGRTVPARLVTRLPAHADSSFAINVLRA